MSADTSYAWAWALVAVCVLVVVLVAVASWRDRLIAREFQERREFIERLWPRDSSLYRPGPGVPADQERFVLRYPLGTFGPGGTWKPNPLVKASEEEQRRHNVKHGYLTAQQGRVATQEKK
jgi:hypothetical protein